jgi:Na+/proline symporter
LIAGLLAASSSSIDSALSALASSAYADIYRKYIRPGDGDEHAVAVSRWLVIIFAGILVAMGLFFCKAESILWLGFRIFGYTYGALLGIFLLAVLTKHRGNDRANVVAMVTSIFVVLFLTSPSVGPLESLRTLILGPLGITAFAWPWAIMIGMLWTFCMGMMFSTKPMKA